MDLILFVLLLILTYITGSIIEKNHYKSIIEREKLLLKQPYVSDQFVTDDQKVRKIELVMGSCVVAADRFKVFLGGLKSLFGGSVTAFESLTDRARREAIVRMRSEGSDADMIVQTRIEFCELGGARIEVLAYGTAVYLEK